MFLSATPAMNNFEKWWVSINLLDDKAIELSENAFKIDISKTIGDKFGTYNIKEYNETKIQEFKDKVLSKYVLRREKSELDEVKHKQIIEPIYIEMTAAQRKIYQVFLQEEVFKLEKEFDSISLKLIFNNFAYLSLVIDNPLLLKDRVTQEELNILLNKWKLESDPRIQYLDSALKESIENQGNKIVIFDNHPSTINLLDERYKKYNPIVMHGRLGDTEEDKFKKAELFNDVNSKYKLFIANPQVAGVGINLNKGTDTIIFYTMPNDSVLYAQALERCDRINNTRDSLIQILIIDNSLDVIRYNRNVNRVLFNNEFLTKKLTKQELRNLLMGIV